MFLNSSIFPAGPPDVGLRAQHENLQQQIPLMYVLMTINVVFLSVVMYRAVPMALSLGAPTALIMLAGFRAILWLHRRRTEPTIPQIRRQLRGTIAAAGVLSVLFGVWALMLFSAADPSRSTAVALYVFVGSISCAYCLQSLPRAAHLVLLFGAAPVTVRMLISGDLYLLGVGFTFVLVAGLIVLTLASTRNSFEEVLRSRAEMSELVSALQRSEEHYRCSVELNPQIPWIADANGLIVELSPRWSDFTGIPLAQALGMGWTRAVHPDDLPALMALFREALATSDESLADARYRLAQADGDYRWFRMRANPRRDPEGTIVSWYGNLEDIDDQVAGERALKESEERYRLASRATKDIIWDWSPTTGSIKWAGDFESILGYREVAQETSIDWWMNHVHPEDLTDVLALYGLVLQNQQDSWSHEHRFRSADGSYRNVFSRGYAIRDNSGTAIRAIGAMSDITSAKQAEDSLRWAAYHDSLTELPNRKFAADELERALERAAAASVSVGVIVVDVDSFKAINDTLGHAAGDAVLRTVAKRLQANAPADATVARLGGDEFAVILPNLSEADASAETVNTILHGVGEALGIEESVMEVSLSAGAAMWPKDGATAEELMKCADLALYVAKSEGAGSVRGFRPAMRDRIEDRNRMLRDAREALHDDRVVPFYQPKLALGSGEVVGFEALLRWDHNHHGLQLPGAIAAAFDDSLLSTNLTDRMLDRVLTDMAGWLDSGQSFGRIAINGSPADFRRDDFADRILTRCHKIDVPPSLLELEVTETVFLDRLADSAERTFRTLRSEGVNIALDDFGTGYASLTHLQQFPVNVLKIDRSFISKLDGTKGPELAIVQGVIDIARRMGIETVAEGIETEVQARDLLGLGCDIGQGFLFSRPIAADRLAAFLAVGSRRDWY
ncbi:EAL domain-containing protein [Sphingomonas sp. S1-29]|nr:GGDEF domain-containing phosphodiesterase [Sphingomonas sp. S1-29]UZK71097.1 EAL domain-containing protein [Sphingomonas sp. S1-29]